MSEYRFRSIYYPSTREPNLGPSPLEDDCSLIGTPEPEPEKIPTLVDAIDLPMFLRKQAQ